ncbi:MAG TPA: bifunctional 4-hydroxy-2-oxoglutarate aldolase/2-dehydro-3-deoxy-phosphogluconate aldolase [Porphyromonadaceae bacterium]|nr:bifunctional 4-hydroxy-2-oxoglutarate aldolase/2-dehydro-3-deoxy-phosphogluconate aldolase [Porphyromonadaceae bacterium]
MARFRRLDVFRTMEETGIVPVFYHQNIELLQEVVAACYKAGIRVFEFTNRGDYAHEVFAQINKWASIHCPEMIMGVGSVVDAGTASLYIQLGANFIVAPILDEPTAIVCNKRKIAWAPGCGTLNEISRAEELGAEIVKIFPGSSVGGPQYVKAIKGPCPWTSVMPTGGVEPTKDSISAWFSAGVTCVGLGSNLFPKEVLEQKDWAVITANCQFALDLVKEIRRNK